MCLIILWITQDVSWWLSSHRKKQWIQRHNWQPREHWATEEGLACGQSSNYIFIQQVDPDVLRRNSGSEREVGFETFTDAGGWIVERRNRSLLSQRFNPLITFSSQLHHLGFYVFFHHSATVVPQMSLVYEPITITAQRSSHGLLFQWDSCYSVLSRVLFV